MYITYNVTAVQDIMLKIIVIKIMQPRIHKKNCQVSGGVMTPLISTKPFLRVASLHIIVSMDRILYGIIITTIIKNALASMGVGIIIYYYNLPAFAAIILYSGLYELQLEVVLYANVSYVFILCRRGA